MNLGVLYNADESAQLGTARWLDRQRWLPNLSRDPPAVIKYKTGHPSFATLGAGHGNSGCPIITLPSAQISVHTYLMYSSMQLKHLHYLFADWCLQARTIINFDPYRPPADVPVGAYKHT